MYLYSLTAMILVFILSNNSLTKQIMLRLNRLKKWKYLFLFNAYSYELTRLHNKHVLL